MCNAFSFFLNTQSSAISDAKEQWDEIAIEIVAFCKRMRKEMNQLTFVVAYLMSKNWIVLETSLFIHPLYIYMPHRDTLSPVSLRFNRKWSKTIQQSTPDPLRTPPIRCYSIII